MRKCFNYIFFTKRKLENWIERSLYSPQWTGECNKWMRKIFLTAVVWRKVGNEISLRCRNPADARAHHISGNGVRWAHNSSWQSFSPLISFVAFVRDWIGTKTSIFRHSLFFGASRPSPNLTEQWTTLNTRPRVSFQCFARRKLIHLIGRLFRKLAESAANLWCTHYRAEWNQSSCVQCTEN